MNNIGEAGMRLMISDYLLVRQGLRDFKQAYDEFDEWSMADERFYNLKRSKERIESDLKKQLGKSKNFWFRHGDVGIRLHCYWDGGLYLKCIQVKDWKEVEGT